MSIRLLHGRLALVFCYLKAAPVYSAHPLVYRSNQGMSCTGGGQGLKRVKGAFLNGTQVSANFDVCLQKMLGAGLLNGSGRGCQIVGNR